MAARLSVSERDPPVYLLYLGLLVDRVACATQLQTNIWTCDTLTPRVPN